MAIMTNQDLEKDKVSPDTDRVQAIVESKSKDDKLDKEMSNWIKWDTWRRGAGFDIANTIYLNEEEKRFLIKCMEEIAKSQGNRQWTTEEICLLKRIKDYNYHIGDWSDRDVEESTTEESAYQEDDFSIPSIEEFENERQKIAYYLRVGKPLYYSEGNISTMKQDGRICILTGKMAI